MNEPVGVGEKKTLSSWELIESREVFRRDPWLTLHLHKVKLPDGRIVEDYFRIDTPEFVVIVAFTKKREIVTLRQYRHGIGFVSITLPGGMMDLDGESPLDCAKRELLEEGGYESPRWVSLGSYIPHSNYGFGKAHFFAAFDAECVCEPNPGDLEDQHVELLEEEVAIEALRDNKVISMSNAAALSLALNPRLTDRQV